MEALVIKVSYDSFMRCSMRVPHELGGGLCIDWV